MNKTKTLCKISLVSIALILLLVSSAALASTENNTGNVTLTAGNATVKDNYISSTALATTEKNILPMIIETRITTSGHAQNPVIYGNRIVYVDDRNGKPDIYMYDLYTKKETRITNSGKVWGSPDIYGDKIVWSDTRNGDHDYGIYMYDLSAKKETRITNSGSASDPAIYGNKIVWSDIGGNDYYHYNIYMYDLSTKKETQITNSDYLDAYAPDIYGNKIVYGLMDEETYRDIYVYDLSTKKENLVSTTGTADDPHIYGNKIVWDDSLASLEDTNTSDDVYMYDLSTKKQTQITSSPDNQGSPAIYGNRIVWEDDGGVDDGDTNHGIYMYDISTNQKMKISAKGSALEPAIYGDKIVWKYGYENSDIYMATVPQPKPPVAAFSASPNSGKAPLKVSFTDKSANIPTSWKWSFGDKTYSTTQNPVHKYSKAGKYTVSLTVKNAKGSNTKTVSGYVTVKK